MWAFISALCGINIDPDDKVIFQAVFPHKLWQTLSKNVRLLIHIIVSAARQTLFGLLYLRKENISTSYLLNTFKREIISAYCYYNTIMANCRTKHI